MSSIKDFKDALSQLPTGVTIISTSYRGNNYGFTASSFAPVSLDPTLILFCLNRKARSYEVFSSSQYFAINILSFDQKDIAMVFSSASSDKFLGINYTLGKYNTPLINDSMSFMECAKYNQYSCGDHDIFVGEVKHIRINNNNSPLVYFNRSYKKLNEQND